MVVKQEEKVVIDLDVLGDSETEVSVRLRDVFDARVELGLEEKRVKKLKDESTAEIVSTLGDMNAEVIIMGSEGFQLQEGGSPGRWNHDVAVALLDPEVLSKIYTPGKKTVRLMPIRSSDAVERFRE